MVTVTPAVKSAHGMLRRALRISSPMKDAVSQPPKANVNDDQKIMSFKCTLGSISATVNTVAEPKRCKAIELMTMMIATGAHMANAPTLCNHLPTPKPTTFMTVMMTNVTLEKAM